MLTLCPCCIILFFSGQRFIRRKHEKVLKKRAEREIELEAEEREQKPLLEQSEEIEGGDAEEGTEREEAEDREEGSSGGAENYSRFFEKTFSKKSSASRFGLIFFPGLHI